MTGIRLDLIFDRQDLKEILDALNERGSARSRGVALFLAGAVDRAASSRSEVDKLRDALKQIADEPLDPSVSGAIARRALEVRREPRGC
jgi:phage-related minor tail protein